MKKKWLSLMLSLLFALPAVAAHDFRIADGKFLLDGKPFQFICGEMHYPRIPQEYWRDRIRRAKAISANAFPHFSLPVNSSASSGGRSTRPTPACCFAATPDLSTQCAPNSKPAALCRRASAAPDSLSSKLSGDPLPL